MTSSDTSPAPEPDTSETWERGDDRRLVETPTDRVQAQWDGFLPAESETPLFDADNPFGSE